MNKKDITPDTMIELMKEYHPGNLKKVQRKYKRLIKKIDKNMIRAAKRGNFSYEHFISPYWLTIKDIDYTEDCIEKIKNHYNNKGFLVDVSMTEKIFLDGDGWPNSERGKAIKISWQHLKIEYKKEIDNSEIDTSISNTILKMVTDAYNDNKTSVTIPNIVIDKTSEIFVIENDIENIIKDSFPNLLITEINWRKDLSNDKLVTWYIEWKIIEEIE